MGTENPTELDIHMYACLSRPYFTKDSVFHESMWTKMAWGQNKRIMRLFEAMQARPEFQSAFSKHVTHKAYLEEVSKQPAGLKVPFWLPMPYQ